jgi:hypothetical protein
MKSDGGGAQRATNACTGQSGARDSHMAMAVMNSNAPSSFSVRAFIDGRAVDASGRF